jgi:hypothetical protein
MRSDYDYAAEASSTRAKGAVNIIGRVPSSHRVGLPLRLLQPKARMVRCGEGQMSEWHGPAPPQSQTTTFRPLHPQKAKHGCDPLALHRSRPRRSTYLSATRLGPGLIYSCD